jgi:multiple sugar transport system substrate-binding protein
MRGVRALVAIAVPSMVLMGCAGVGSKTAEAPAKGASAYEGTPEGPLKVMGFSGEDEVAQSRISAFKQSAPKVQVTNNKGDFDAQQFLTALASGNPPDLVYMDRNLVGTYAAKGAIQPMTDCIAQQKIDVSQYRPAAMTPITLDKVVYGIPEFYVVTTNLEDAGLVPVVGDGQRGADRQAGRVTEHQRPQGC